MINSDLPIKLHLGCGQTYLNGYLNIDYPPGSHTVQKKTVADQFEDITQLSFKRRSVQQYTLDKKLFDQIAPEIPDYIEWYGAKGAAYFELPHYEIRGWKEKAESGELSLVEPLF